MTAKQLQREENFRAERELKRAIAFEVATRYCLENNLSVDKLRTQRFEWLGDVALFAQPSEVKPDGLLNDMETMPYPTLILTSDEGDLVVKQTEHTRKYLAN